MRFRTLALALAISFGVAGVMEAAAKHSAPHGAKHPKARKAKKSKQSHASAKASNVKPRKAKKAKKVKLAGK